MAQHSGSWHGPANHTVTDQPEEPTVHAAEHGSQTPNVAGFSQAGPHGVGPAAWAAKSTRSASLLSEKTPQNKTKPSSAAGRRSDDSLPQRRHAVAAAIHVPVLLVAALPEHDVSGCSGGRTTCGMRHISGTGRNPAECPRMLTTPVKHRLLPYCTALPTTYYPGKNNNAGPGV